MYDLPWTLSSTLVDKRMFDELLKYGQGDWKAHFSIPIKWIDEFDLFSNLRLQDPFGLGGVGEYGRYYYIESITYDFMNDKMDIVAIDMYYILRQCFILGDCDEIPDTWEETTYEQKMFGYLCDCDAGDDGQFSDGEICKVLCLCRA